MRKRHNLAPRMEACAAYLIDDPATLRGEWLAAFPEQRELWVELGCGKGRFTVETAEAHPEAVLLAIEKVPDAMVLAMERAKMAGVTNVRFMDFDAAALSAIFAPGEVDRIFLNFSDPWPKSRDAKFRLTSPGFLRLYADALPLGGQIHFKTDNAPLFAWSLDQLAEEGWALSEVTDDLHRDGPVGVMTDYEAKFYAEGLKIHRLVATRTEATRTTAAGPVPRLRDAALSDARGARSARCGRVPDAPLRLEKATLALCHAYFRDYQPSPELFEDPSKLEPYVYEAEKVDAWFTERSSRPNEQRFYVLLGERPIGDLVFKRIDREQKRCELGICLVNERCKGKGYGTAAERLALDYGFGELGMETILADTLLANTRSQRVLAKLGFRCVGADEHFKYYELRKEQYLREKGEL